MRTAPGGVTRVAAVAAYDRRYLTLLCVRSLRAQRVLGVALDGFVFDDARRHQRRDRGPVPASDGVAR
jgi:hypothetical protein